MKSEEYLEWCEQNDLDSSLDINYYLYVKNEEEHQAYLNMHYEEDEEKEVMLSELSI